MTTVAARGTHGPCLVVEGATDCLAAVAEGVASGGFEVAFEVACRTSPFNQSLLDRLGVDP
jgi:hypothetical protein